MSNALISCMVPTPCTNSTPTQPHWNQHINPVPCAYCKTHAACELMCVHTVCCLSSLKVASFSCGRALYATSIRAQDYYHISLPVTGWLTCNHVSPAPRGASLGLSPTSSASHPTPRSQGYKRDTARASKRGREMDTCIAYVKTPLYLRTCCGQPPNIK
jgi:hypothetical protein